MKISRSLCFLALFAVSLFLFRQPLQDLIVTSSNDERYSYLIAVPFISAFLLWFKRDQFQQDARFAPQAVPLFLAALLLAHASLHSPISAMQNALTVQLLALVLLWLAMGLCCYGPKAFRAALFPALFLLLLIPLPPHIMEKMTVSLQKGSAECTAALFTLTGMPFSRAGFTFALPGVNIRVAEECSGIRSGISMFIAAILTGFLFLKSGWSRIAFVLLAIPAAILKNAVRIVTISWLGVRVDPGYFTGKLHHYGGLPFTLLVMVILAPALLALLKVEGQGIAGRGAFGEWRTGYLD